MAKQDNELTLWLKAQIFKHRRRSMLGRATNVLEALDIKNRFNQTPEVIKHGKSKAGYFILYNLPEGIEKAVFEKNVNHFNEQLGGRAQFTMTGTRTLKMDIITYEFPKEILYNFTPGNKGIELPIGYDVNGSLITAQLDEIYHILINGITGGGKSNTLHQWIYCLIQQGCIIFFIDLMKKEFRYLQDHAFLAFDAPTAAKFLKGLNEIMEKRLELMDKHDVFKASELPFHIPRIALVIDELGDVLLHDKLGPDLNRLARGGRAPAISIIAANQRNDSKFFNSNWSQTRHLFAGALCFPVKDRFTSDMILGNDLASKLPRDKPGRAIWQFSEDVEVQTMYYPNSLARSNIKLLESTKGEVEFQYDSGVSKKLPVGR